MAELDGLTPFEKMIVRKIYKLEDQLTKRNKQKEWIKQIQERIDQLIPQEIHHSLAVALEKGTKAFLQGLNLIEIRKQGNEQNQVSLESLAEQANILINRYKKIAMVEGAGTGIGGFLSSAIDFPLLLSIKLKLLQELAQLFGYRLNKLEERIYILRILQFQFSAGQHKKSCWLEIKQWTNTNNRYVEQTWAEFDWDLFYMEYKQSIELRKLLQMIPGFGAVVGAWANHSFIDELGRTATLCLLWRRIQEKKGCQAK